MSKKKKNSAVKDDELGGAGSSKIGGTGNYLGEPLIAREQNANDLNDIEEEKLLIDDKEQKEIMEAQQDRTASVNS